jgi:hypothetical protein
MPHGILLSTLFIVIFGVDLHLFGGPTYARQSWGILMIQMGHLLKDMSTYDDLDLNLMLCED